MHEQAIAGLGYKPGWKFKLGGPGRRWLCAFATTADTLNPSRHRTTQHMWEIPDGLDDHGFAVWVRDRLLDAERHETCEWLSFAGDRPFWPRHGDGDPYGLVDRWEGGQ